MNKRIRNLVLLLGAVLLLGCIGTDITLAYLQSRTQNVVNSFSAAELNIKVVESDGKSEAVINEDQLDPIVYEYNGDNYTKKEVRFLNDKDKENKGMDALIRVHLIPILRDREGNNVGSVSVQYLEPSEKDWSKVGDYYYYKKILKKGETTSPVINGVKAITDIPTGGNLEVQVLVEAVQAYPTKEQVEKVELTPAYQLWGYYPL